MTASRIPQISGFESRFPRVGYWDYQTRAKIIELKERLIAALKLTRGGNISTHQAEQPMEEGYRYLIANSKAFVSIPTPSQLMACTNHTLWN